MKFFTFVLFHLISRQHFLHIDFRPHSVYRGICISQRYLRHNTNTTSTRQTNTGGQLIVHKLDFIYISTIWALIFSTTQPDRTREVATAHCAGASLPQSRIYGEGHRDPVTPVVFSLSHWPLPTSDFKYNTPQLTRDHFLQPSQTRSACQDPAKQMQQYFGRALN